MNDDLFVSLVVHGESKAGKTWLGATAPKPLLVLDSEAGGMRFVPGRKIVWDPMKEDPPVADGTWDICRVRLDKTSTLDVVKQYIETGRHPFVAIVFDSLSEYQARLKREIEGSGQLDQQDWGRMLTSIEDIVMELRDAVERQDQLKALVVITGTRLRDGKFRPFLQGQMSLVLPYKLDVNGYLFTQVDGNGVLRRGLRIEAHGDIDAGNRLGGSLPGVVWDPNVETMLETMNNFFNNPSNTETQEA